MRAIFASVRIYDLRKLDAYGTPMQIFQVFVNKRN